MAVCDRHDLLPFPWRAEPRAAACRLIPSLAAVASPEPGSKSAIEPKKVVQQLLDITPKLSFLHYIWLNWNLRSNFESVSLLMCGDH